VAVGGTGETTYAGNKPVSATATVDPTAQMYDPYVCRLAGRPNKADVFIRGTGREAYEIARRTFSGEPSGEDRFSVIGVRPHLALEIKGATSEHRIFIGPEQPDQLSLLSAPGNTEHKSGDVLFFPLPGRSGDLELEIIVQKCERASFVVEVPGGARIKKSFEKFRLPFFSN
jgi:hypothetical protein